MAQPHYNIWLLDEDYTKTALVQDWVKLIFWQKLNGLGPLEELSLAPNNSVIPDLTFGKTTRLQIYRDGTLVWGGTVEGERWQYPNTAPIGATYRLYGQDYAAYAQQRIVVPPDGYDWDERTDALDDLAKQYVRAHMGASAAAARQFSDLTVDADAGECSSAAKAYGYETVLEVLKDLAKEGGFYWRFVPTATGCTFTTAYPLWGTDKTQGNDPECVLSYDRRNILDLSYTSEVVGHANYVYIAGAGAGLSRITSTASTAADITSYGRREMFYNSPRYSTAAELAYEGALALNLYKPAVELSLRHVPLMWIDDYVLGDQISILLHDFREFDWDATVTAVRVTIDTDGIEYVDPQLE